MRKKVILISVPLIILASYFIHIRVDKTVIVKSPFINIYGFLSQPDKWEKWLPGLRQSMLTDSTKVSVQKKPNEFTLQYAPIQLAVKAIGNEFNVKEHNDNKTRYYSYVLTPVQDKFMNKTYITAEKKISILKYCFGLIVGNSFNDTHVDYLKTYLETDSLYYGYNIFRTGAPESYLIVARKEVLQKDKFSEAAKMQDMLNQYTKAKSVKQMAPVIAQFLPNGPDSTQVKVGLFINQEVPSTNQILFSRMPKGGPFVCGLYKGEFLKRGKAYAAVRQYFSDHTYQAALLPFDSYLNNKLPLNDHDIVNIQIDFPTFPEDKPKPGQPQ